MDRLYPVMLRLEGERCLVIGGGKVAERKVRGLLEAGAEVCVVAPHLTPGLEQLAAEGMIGAVRREYREQDLEGAKLVYAAAGSRDVNSRAAADARRLGIPAGVADCPEEGAFVTPAVVRRGKLILAVTASGASPALAAAIADELAGRYGESYEDFTEWLGRLREAAMTAVPDSLLRRRLLREALALPETQWREDTNEERIATRIRTLTERLQGRSTEDEG